MATMDSPPTQQPLPSQPQPGHDFKASYWVIGAVAVGATLLAIAAFVLVGQSRKGGEEQQTSQLSELPISSPEPNVSPPTLPPVQGEEKTSSLRAYFASVSPNNFKEEFMAKVPDVAANSYIEYSKAQGDEAKSEAARAFYIYLNNPAADTGDPSFAAFLADVKADLEKTLGKPLF